MLSMRCIQHRITTLPYESSFINTIVGQQYYTPTNIYRHPDGIFENSHFLAWVRSFMQEKMLLIFHTILPCEYSQK